MSKNQISQEALEQGSVEPNMLSPESEQVSEKQAQTRNDELLDADAQQAEKQTYMERPKYQRVFAWALAIAVFVGVMLYYAWLAGILK